ncbi:MAG: hypothetical protein OXU79_02845 [Gemmatimonadota bacterium]|nr:hypothetical protein [Gemmatimonadota bacterium]
MAELEYRPIADTYYFETEAMTGEIRASGNYHGVWALTDKVTGRQVIHPEFSALNLFRLFAVHQGLDQPRLMDRTIDARDNGIEIHWAATETHQGALTARYEVVEPNCIDLTVTVACEGTYAGYELFLSNYFDKTLRPHVYLHGSRYGRASEAPELVVPVVNDVFRGTVIVFPRDPHAARRCVDGRWNRSESNSPTVQMCPVRYYGYPFSFLTDDGNRLGVVLMSTEADCYAISTRYHVDDEADRMTDYSAFDFSLFGDDMVPGSRRAVRMRLALTEVDEKLTQPLAHYQSFAEG